MNPANFIAPSIFKSVKVESKKIGKLSGLNFAVKDVIDIQGIKTGCGSPLWLSKTFVAQSHAVCVELLLNSGAECIGKTVMGELCFGTTGHNEFYGMPLNHYSPNQVPGGSSSGSASVVAEGKVDFSLGTDTAGSVRVPASYCGIFGIRYSHNIISMGGVKSFSPSFDTLGVFSRSLKIIGLVSEVLIGFPDIKTKKIGHVYYIKELIEVLEAEQILKFQSELYRYCKEWNITPSEICYDDILPEGYKNLDSLGDAFKNILCSEIWSNLGPWVIENNLEYAVDTYIDFTEIKKNNRNTLVSAIHFKNEFYKKINHLLGYNNLLFIPTHPDKPILRSEQNKKINNFNYKKLRPYISISSMAELPQISIPSVGLNISPSSISVIAASKNDNFLIEMISNVSF